MKHYLPEGIAWNPTLKYPRNSPCFCGSGIKFKKCHLDEIARAVPQEHADKFRVAVNHVRNSA